eukprot:g41043.t1
MAGLYSVVVEPNETTNELDQSTERSMGELAKKEMNWNPLEGHCPGPDRIPHDDGIAVTASILNTPNWQFPDAILQLICFILDHNAFIFDNQFFIQTHRTAMETRFAPQYTNIFMH